MRKEEGVRIQICCLIRCSNDFSQFQGSILCHKEAFMSWRFHNGRLSAPNGGEWAARSGPWGKGKLPDGLYRIGAAVSLSGASNTSYKDAADFAWWCPITPRFETPRSGLGIHPDGGISGTLGCVGIVDGNTWALYRLLLRAEGETLLVGQL